MFDVMAIAIGNTNTTIAYFKNGEIKRLDNKKTKYVSSKLKLLAAEKIVISSVVPKATAVILKMYPLAEILTLQNISDVSFPENIGIDRAINVVTAMKLYKTKNVLVVDIGTALTFTCCLSGKFKGGLIMPGYGLSKKTLFSNTALLPVVSDDVSDNIFCQQTNMAMASGILNLYKRSINSLIEEYRTATNQELVVVATGGDAILFADYSNGFDVVNPTLLLEGISILFSDKYLFY